MSRAVITPVGTSSMTTSLCWTGLPPELAAPAGWRAIAADPALLERAKGFMAEIWAGGPEAVADRFDHAAWNLRQLPRMSAELASLRLIHDQLALSEDDRIILIFGDNQPGSGRMLQSLVPMLEWGVAGSPKVEPWPVAGLDATDPRAFCRAASGLDGELRHRLDRNEELVFNLTGGFKGTVALLSHHASVRARAGVAVRLFYLYEAAQGLIELELVDRNQQNERLTPIVRG